MSEILNLKSYRYNGQKFSDIKEWDVLIEKMLENIGFEHNSDYRYCVENKKKYFLSKNPFGDGNVMSCMIHCSSGNMRIYNSSLPTIIRSGKPVKDCSLTITECARLFTEIENSVDSFDDYIDFILDTYSISSNVFNQYKKALLEAKLNEINAFKRVIQSKGFYEFRKLLFSHYITDNDIMKVKERKYSRTIIKKEKTKHDADEIVKPDICESSVFGKLVVERYLRKRDLLDCDLIRPVEVRWKAGSYINYGVAIKYGNGFQKIRLLENKKMRYFADGKYEEFLYVKDSEDAKELLLIEGEFEAVTISKYLSNNEDVYAMHNINSLPSDLIKLKKYDKISIRIDYDNKQKFEEVSQMLYGKLSEYNVEIKPKFYLENGKIDYNYIHCNYGLSKEIILNPEKTEDFLQIVGFREEV